MSDSLLRSHFIDAEPDFAMQLLGLKRPRIILMQEQPRARVLGNYGQQASIFGNDPDIIAKVSRGLGQPMSGLAARSIPEKEQLAVRGW